MLTKLNNFGYPNWLYSYIYCSFGNWSFI